MNRDQVSFEMDGRVGRSNAVPTSVRSGLGGNRSTRRVFLKFFTLALALFLGHSTVAAQARQVGDEYGEQIEQGGKFSSLGSNMFAVPTS